MRRPPVLALLAALAGLVAALAAGAAPAAAADRLTVMLDWFVNPNHAPLVIARDKGFFAAENLQVELVPPADPSDPPKLVGAKQADIAVSYEVITHLQAQEGLPLVRIGALVDTPLSAVAVLADGPVETLAGLKGRKVGFSVAGADQAVLGAMLARNGLSLADVELVNVNFALSPALLSGQVDAVVGVSRNFEPNQMALAGHPARLFFPEEQGVPAYDELVYLAHRDSLGRPELPRFLRALEAATAWLLNHPGEAWDVFKAADPALDDELNRRAWNDTLPRFAHDPAALDPGRYDRFAGFLLRQGLLERRQPVADYAVELAPPP